MNKNIINTIIQIKNAYLAKKESARVPFTRLNYKILLFMYNEGFIQSFKKEKKVLIIFLRFSSWKNFFKNLKIMSSPALNCFLSYKDICRIKNKRFVLVLSTIKGFLTGCECKKKKIGGKLFFTF